MTTMRIDLTQLIAQAVPQVFGSDERLLLDAWLERNAGAEQIVEIDLNRCEVPDEPDLEA